MEEPSAPKLVEELIARAETARASDIHLQMAGGPAEVAFRLDGVITPVSTLPDKVAERVFGRIKYLAKLRTYQESLPQDGRIDKANVNSSEDIRVSTYPTVTGEKIVLRLFTSETAKSLPELGLPEDARSGLESVLSRTSGLVLLTGPAGSGKTTTIYACLRYLAESGGRHIITVEDPVEQVLPGVMQTEVNEARGLNYAMAARHLLRQDPQVLVIGEVRDEETAQICVRAASTGHLVISTLHAGSCRGVLDRLLLLCPDSYGVMASLELILNQRLVRRVCSNCKGSGCDRCLDTGFKGRIPLVEYIQITQSIRQQLVADRTASLAPARNLAESGRELVQRGLTTATELERVVEKASDLV